MEFVSVVHAGVVQVLLDSIAVHRTMLKTMPCLKKTWHEKNNWMWVFDRARINAPTMVSVLTGNVCVKQATPVSIVPWWKWAMIRAKTSAVDLVVPKHRVADVGWVNVFVTLDFKVPIVLKY